jgi:hypothetical protein
MKCDHTDKDPVRRQKKTEALQEDKETESQALRTRIIPKLLVRDSGKMRKFDEQHHSGVNLFSEPFARVELNMPYFEEAIQINSRIKNST